LTIPRSVHNVQRPENENNREEAAVYLTLRRYAEIGARMYEIVFRKVEAGLVPMLKARPGFRSYCALLNEEGEGVSVTAFDDRESAARANEEVFGWVEANLRDLLPDPPEVIAGECGLAEAAPERGGAGHDRRQPQPPFVVVREFADLGPPEGAREAQRRLALPLIAGAPGFRSVCLFRDEREPARAAMVALFDTRAEALRAHERSMQAFREAAAADGEAWPEPRVGVGRAIVFAEADQ
jgi:heme-degrading monooxygenase HmoA